MLAVSTSVCALILGWVGRCWLLGWARAWGLALLLITACESTVTLSKTLILEKDPMSLGALCT